jgi:hypothetical protein
VVETSMIPHFLDNRLTDGREVSALRAGSALHPTKIFWYPGAESTLRP